MKQRDLRRLELRISNKGLADIEDQEDALRARLA